MAASLMRTISLVALGQFQATCGVSVFVGRVSTRHFFFDSLNPVGLKPDLQKTSQPLEVRIKIAAQKLMEVQHAIFSR